MLILLYKSKLKKYHAPTELAAPSDFVRFPKEQPQSNYSLPTSVLDISAPSLISTPNDENSRKVPKLQIPNKPINNSLNRLKNSLDLIVAQAEKYYYDCDYQQCSLLTEKVLKQDPYHLACLPIHISCQVELKESNSKLLYKFS